MHKRAQIKTACAFGNSQAQINWSRVPCFILHEHPVHSQDTHKLMQTYEKSYGIPEWVKFKATIKKSLVSQELQTNCTGKDVNSVLRWKVQMHTEFANSL